MKPTHTKITGKCVQQRKNNEISANTAANINQYARFAHIM